MLLQPSIAGDFDQFTIQWDQGRRTAIVKLDTPGYPFWLLDREKAPMYHKDSANFYRPDTIIPSAILLNLTLSHDHKTLLLNHEPILPVADVNAPPRIYAYQVPAHISERQVRNMISFGIMNRQWEGLTTAWRYLSIDYERVVSGDPQKLKRVWKNGFPLLKFRIMGIGAHEDNQVLEAFEQPVLHVQLENTLANRDPPPPPRFEFDKVITSYEAAYQDTSEVMDQYRDGCTMWSWRCPDLHVNEVEKYAGNEVPYYRYIWRNRFDEFGRIGSLRHAVMRKTHVLRVFWEDAGTAMLLSYSILCSIALGVIGLVRYGKYHVRRRGRWFERYLEEDALLGAKEKAQAKEKPYMDDDDDEDIDLDEKTSVILASGMVTGLPRRH